VQQFQDGVGVYTRNSPCIISLVSWLQAPEGIYSRKSDTIGLYSFILRIKLYDLKTEVNQNKVKLKIK
jgi:hypothetical protein